MWKGIAYIILSGLSFFVVNFFVKILGNSHNSIYPGLQEYPVQELVFARSLISFGISAAVIKYKGIPFFGNNKKWLFLRGTSGMFALTLFFFTLHHLPLAIASTMQYLSPIFTVMLSYFIFREKVSKMQASTIFVSFLGVGLIGWVGTMGSTKTANIDPFWLVVALISAALSGLAYNSIVKLRDTDLPVTIVMYFPMIALPISGVWCLYESVPPKGIEWLFLVLIGVFTQIAQILMTRAFLQADAVRIAPFQYLGAIYAVITGWFLFDEKLESLSLIGIAIVLFGVVAGLFSKPSKNGSPSKL